MDKKRTLLLCLVFCISLFNFPGCVKKVNEKQLTDISSEEDPLELKLYVDKDTYAHEEAITCYATLEYTGDQDSITVYSADPLVSFALKDDKYFNGEYFRVTILMPTTINKGEIVRFDYRKSGILIDDDPNADFYRDFYAEKELRLPEGTYEISATIDCSLDKDDLDISYNKTVSAFISVK